METQRAPCILLVEDHVDTAHVAARLLRGHGYKVTIAGDMRAARLAASSQPFDLALCDIGLPDGDGCDLMMELQAKYLLRGIALTGYAMPDDNSRIDQAGFIARLVKPIDFQELSQAVAKALTPHPGSHDQPLGSTT